MTKIALFLVVLIGCATEPETSSTLQELSTGTVSLACPSTASGSAVGTYGGVAFNMACKKNKTTTLNLSGLVDFNFSVRVGYQTHAGAGDCLMNGTAPDVRPCGQSGVTLSLN